MSETPALRLLTETLRADNSGLAASSQHRQVLLHGAGVIQLRQALGNDGYDVLETLFILAEPTPTGVVVHNGAVEVAKILQWSRQRASRVISALAEKGYLERTQEATTDKGTGRPRFGRGVIRLDVSAPVTVDEVSEASTPQPSGGVWGTPLSPASCREVLTAWGVSDANRLVDSDTATLVSDAVKFVAFELRSGTPINNPGAYVRTAITRRKVAAPAPHVPEDYLTGELTAADLLQSDRGRGERTLEQARRAARARRRYLQNLLESLDGTRRDEIGLRLDDMMRAFTFESEETQQVKYFTLLEQELANEGLLAPDLAGSEPADAAPWQEGDGEEPPF